MKEQTIFVIGVIICLLGMLTITTIQRENLIIEKEALKVQNHMLTSKFTTLPVLHNGLLVGLINIRDVNGGG